MKPPCWVSKLSKRSWIEPIVSGAIIAALFTYFPVATYGEWLPIVAFAVACIFVREVIRGAASELQSDMVTVVAGVVFSAVWISIEAAIGMSVLASIYLILSREMNRQKSSSEGRSTTSSSEEGSSSAGHSDNP